MTHTIKMAHNLTKDEKGVYMDFLEDGRRLYVSDIKKHSYFHQTRVDGGLLAYEGLQLLDGANYMPICMYTPTGYGSGVMGTFMDGDKQQIGSLESIGSGLDRYYVANIQGMQYVCYPWTHRLSPCLMIYKDGVQKAMLIEDKLSHNQMFSMTLHILDDENVSLLCTLAYAYHDIANVHNMQSTFHRHFLTNGYRMNFQSNEANYHMEHQYKGIGKDFYHVEFLSHFYPRGSEMLEKMEVTPEAVWDEAKVGLKASAGEAFSSENIRKRLFNDPVAIILLVGVALVMCIVLGFVGYSMAGGIGFVLGFLFALFLIGVCYGLFFLMVYVLWKNFGNKGK